MGGGEGFFPGDPFGRLGVVVLRGLGEDLLAVFVDHRLDRPGARFAKGTNRFAVDLVSNFLEGLHVIAFRDFKGFVAAGNQTPGTISAPSEAGGRAR